MDTGLADVPAACVVMGNTPMTKPNDNKMAIAFLNLVTFFDLIIFSSFK